MPITPPIIRINALQLSELVIQEVAGGDVRFMKSEPANVHAETMYPNGLKAHITIQLDGTEQASLEVLLQQIRARIARTLTGE